ncbi:MAG: hypothetical protein M3010_12440 [Candidatus Dormibacteraeota bacterium]|nr:hypothetical protein [Candidatus Dormibacteraeota bacterium]
MNYYHFEREVLGHQRVMRCRAERSALLRQGRTVSAGSTPAEAHLRFRVAGALRTLANRLDAPPAHLA